MRISVLQALVGGAVLIGLLFTWQQQRSTSQQFVEQLDLSRQEQIGERFSRAVGQLGVGSVDVRLGGIYELEQLARQATDRRVVIFEVLSAYIRQHAPRGPTRPGTSRGGAPGTRPLTTQSSLRIHAPDIQAALMVLSRRQVLDSDPIIDLSAVSVAGADLHDAALDGADLSGADLHGAILHGADLRSASLHGADMRNTILAADLRGADLEDADLRGARLDTVSLSSLVPPFKSQSATGNLDGADLHGALSDSTTLWPEGFDPKAAGVRMIQP